MGGAVAGYLTTNGLCVTAFEPFTPPHLQGACSGILLEAVRCGMPPPTGSLTGGDMCLIGSGGVLYGIRSPHALPREAHKLAY